MKQKKQVFILLALIVVMAAGYFGLQAWNQAREQADLPDDTVSIALWPEDAGQISAISYDYEDAIISLTYSAEGNTWQNAQDPAFPLESVYAANMAAALRTLTATRELTQDAADFSAFGFSNPTMTITVQTVSGNIVLRVGNFNSIVGQYYISISTSQSAYLVGSDFLSNFQYGLYDMITEEELPYMTLSVVENATVIYGGDTWSYILREDGDAFVWYQYRNDEITGTAVETEDVKAYLSGCLAVSGEGWVNYNASLEDLAAYGLAEPAATVIIGYMVEESEENGENVTVTHYTYTLQIGDTASTDEEAGVSYVYATTTATDRVFLIDKVVLDTLLAGIDGTVSAE